VKYTAGIFLGTDLGTVLSGEQNPQAISTFCRLLMAERVGL
jgi:hypothetical protein